MRLDLPMMVLVQANASTFQDGAKRLTGQLWPAHLPRRIRKRTSQPGSNSLNAQWAAEEPPLDPVV